MKRARLSRALGGIVTLGLAAGVVVAAPATQAAASGTNYVALGDSYSSGVGAGDYTSSSGSCDRSPNGYPALWAAEHSPASFTSVACSGAKTSDVLANQVGALSGSTTLVSITIGGNDVGFSSVMEDCVLETDSGCKSAVDKAESYARDTLPGLLNHTYATIRSDAPNAHVVVLDYPEFYKLGGNCIAGIGDTKRGYIDHGADVLDGVISAAAQRAGFSFADVRSAFAAGHEICGSGENWLHSLDWTDITDSYHPKPDGYRYGYLPALDAKD